MAAATRQRESFLPAGALLSMDADGDAPFDPVCARRYHNPALGGQAVVRLAGETVAIACYGSSPLAPPHELFAAAWGRIHAGDRPGPPPQGGTA